MPKYQEIIKGLEILMKNNLPTETFLSADRDMFSVHHINHVFDLTRKEQIDLSNLGWMHMENNCYMYHTL